MKRNNGFILVTSLVLGLAIGLIGATGLIISSIEYKTLTAQRKYYTAQEIAERGLKEAVRRLAQGIENCSSLNGQNIEGANIKTAEAVSSCFIWVEGREGNARALLATVVSFSGGYWGAIIIDNDLNLTLNNGSIIEACFFDCPSSAIVLGGELLGGNYNMSLCSEGSGDIMAQVQPLRENLDLANLYSLIFTEYIGSRANSDGLFARFMSLYDINIDVNDGNPNYFNPLLDASGGCRRQFNNCFLNDDQLICDGNSFTFTQDGFYLPDYGRCKSLDLGFNANLEIGRFAPDDINFIPKIAAQNIRLVPQDGEAKIENVIVVARESFTVQANDEKIEIENVGIFAKNISLSGNKLKINRSLIYGGTNISIDISGDSELGEFEFDKGKNEGVIIISDGSLTINATLKGDDDEAKFAGIIFVTEQGNLSININNGVGKERALFSGVIASLGRSNTINLNNAVIQFNPYIFNFSGDDDEDEPNILEMLSLSQPSCGGGGSVKGSLITTTISIY